VLGDYALDSRRRKTVQINLLLMILILIIILRENVAAE
jgi:hypothetical protein